MSADSSAEFLAPSISEKVRTLRGPVLILGAGGFVGANLMRLFVGLRADVYGTTTRLPAWRLEDLPQDRVKVVDLLVYSNLDQLLDTVKPRAIFDCVA
jgi:polyisoprenyl-phosphate glycosyltransferase